MYSLKFESEHSTPSRHHYNCICDTCCPPDPGYLAFEIHTCTCEICDSDQIGQRIANGEPISIKDDYAAKDEKLYKLPDESRLIKSYETDRETIEIHEELYGYSTSAISKIDGFTGETTFVLDLKEAEEVASEYLNASPCPKITDISNPDCDRPECDHLEPGITAYLFSLWP